MSRRCGCPTASAARRRLCLPASLGLPLLGLPLRADRVVALFSWLAAFGARLALGKRVPRVYASLHARQLAAA